MCLRAAAFLVAVSLPASAQTSWPTASPQSVGVRAAVLDSIDSEIASGRYGYVDRMVVVRRGKLIYDKSYKQDYDKAYADSATVIGPLNAHDLTGPYNYYNPWWHPFYRRGDLHSLQSVTKTLTSVVIGVAVARGDFPNIDTPVLEFFDETKVANIDDRKRRMTVKHLISMTSGIDWTENLAYTDPRNTAIQLEKSDDWVKFTIDRPMAREPGEVFNYNSGATELLAHIFRRATGADIEEYAARHLFAPLGITRWHWKRIPTGLIDTEGGAYLEAKDLAKIWYLFLKNGEWDGKRIVTPEWVKLSVSPIVATAPNPAAPRYGLAWWLMPDPRNAEKWLWYGSGFGGQFPIAFPDDDMVVVFNAWNILPGKGSLPLRQVVARLVNAL